MAAESPSELLNRPAEPAPGALAQPPLTRLVASYRNHTQLTTPRAPATGAPLSGARLWTLSGFEIIAVLYFAAIAAAELVTTFGNARLGMGMHAAILTALLFHAAFVSSESQRRFLLSLSLAPLIRIFSLSLPLQHLKILYWYGIVAVPLFVAGIAVARTLRLSLRELGFTLRYLPFQLLFGASGFLLGMTEYLILRPAPLIAHLSLQSAFLPSLIILIGTGLAEEFVFRGIMQSAARGAMGALTILYVSLVFASLHIGYKSVVDLIFVFGVGLLFACVVQRTGSILGTTLSHGIANIALYLVVPFLGFAGAVAPAAGAKAPATVVPAVSQPRAAATARAAHTGTGAAEASATAQAPVALSGAAAAAIQHAAGVIRGRAASAASQAAAATVTATSQQSVALPTAPIVHIVRPGENLSSIAAANGIDVGQILYFNAIPDPNHIVAGQRLVLWSPP